MSNYNRRSTTTFLIDSFRLPLYPALATLVLSLFVRGLGLSVGLGLFTKYPCQAIEAPPWSPALRTDCKANESLQLHTRFVSEIKKRKPKVLFLGDSILAYWPVAGANSWNNYFRARPSFDIAIGGEITQSILWRLDNGAVDNVNPAVVVLMVGSNNLVVNSPTDTVHGVETVIEKLHAKLPRSKVLLLSILPRDPGKVKIPLRSKIDEANILLKKLSVPNTAFVDVSQCMLSKDGTIDKECMPDGIHPSAAGYERLAPLVDQALSSVCR